MTKKELKIKRKSRYSYKNSLKIKIYYILLFFIPILFIILSITVSNINHILSIILVIIAFIIMICFLFLISISMRGYKLKYLFLGKKFKQNMLDYISIDTQKDYYRQFGSNGMDKRYYILEYVYNKCSENLDNYNYSYEYLMDFMLTGLNCGIEGYFLLKGNALDKKINKLKSLMPAHIMTLIEECKNDYLNDNNINLKKYNDIIFSSSNINIYKDIIVENAKTEYDNEGKDLNIYY